MNERGKDTCKQKDSKDDQIESFYFLKVAQARGLPWDLFGFRLFYLSIRAPLTTRLLHPPFPLTSQRALTAHGKEGKCFFIKKILKDRGIETDQ